MKRAYIMTMFLLMFTISCASTSNRIQKLEEHNKMIEAEIIGEGLKNIISSIPKDKVGLYMKMHEEELFRVLKERVIIGIAKHDDVLTVIFDVDSLFPENLYIPKIEVYVLIDKIAEVINKFRHTMIFVTGNYTLRSGDIYKLAEARAVTIGDVLVQRGVNGMRVFSIGLDDYVPLTFLEERHDRISIVIIPITD